MDSLSTLGYPAYGCGIRYKYGMFEQKIENGYQLELPDQWMQTGFNWEVRKPKHRVPVKFFGKIVFVWLFIPMLGYFGVIICEPVIWCCMCLQLAYSFYHDSYIKGIK